LLATQWCEVVFAKDLCRSCMPVDCLLLRHVGKAASCVEGLLHRFGITADTKCEHPVYILVDPVRVGPHGDAALRPRSEFNTSEWDVPTTERKMYNESS
jgi:hypothetical protein